jgi:uncharacterized protein (DUF736 family)
MAITLGSFTLQGTGSLTGHIKTLNFTAAIAIVPTDKTSENAPDYRIYAGRGAPQNFEVGAAWSQTAKSSGETYLNLKLAAPEFCQHWLRARLVKLETPNEDGSTHIALWQPRDQ